MVILSDITFSAVVPGFEPGIHVCPPHQCKTWMAGTSPAMTMATVDALLKRDDFKLNRHHALDSCLSMIFSENRFPLFGIML
jgi:hypothetical protein